MKRGYRICLLTLIPITLITFGAYLLLAAYYQDSFSFHTYINGIYCTGKTVEEVNTELLSQMEGINIAILDRDGNFYEFIEQDHPTYIENSLSIEIPQPLYTADFTPHLLNYIEQQNPWLWINNLFIGRENTLHPEMQWEEENLLALWESLPFVQEEAATKRIIEIRLGEEGYWLYESLSDRLDVERGFELLVNALEQGQNILNLEEQESYTDYPLSEEQKATLALWEKIDKFQECPIVYDMGDAMIPLNASIMCRFITLDKNGSFLLDSEGELVLNEEEAEKYLRDLMEGYNTFGVERDFMSTRGEIISVMGVTYGTLIDIEAEKEHLLQILRNRSDTKYEVRIPTYIRTGEVRGKDDIGGTYIEIDMTQQKMYFYKDRECIVETEIVTGNTGRRMGTPEGVNYVYTKQRNRVLRGPGYASFVKYWMPVKGNIGIHDASWRNKFGGEIYKTDGSRGCINTPEEHMTIIYEMAEIGTPVILFY